MDRRHPFARSQPSPPQHILRTLLAAAVLTVLGFVGVLRRPVAEDRLARALTADRFTMGRLSGQTAWAPCVLDDTTGVVPRSSCGAAPRAGTQQLEQIQRLARAVRQRQPSGRSSPASLRAGALLDLRFLDDAPTGIDHAVHGLDQALATAADSAALLNDLAVAYLEQGERDQRLTPMLQALDAVERAATRDSLAPAILFNRALILQRLYLLDGASRAWARYLAVERDPRWRSEAQAHAARVARAADTLSWDGFLHAPPARMDAPARAAIAARVRRSPQKAREFGIFPLLAEWGRAVHTGDSARAAQLLALAREIGAAVVVLDVDRSVALAVEAIDRGSRDAERLHALAGGHAALEQGYEAFRRGKNPDAIRLLDSAQAALLANGSPAARWAAFYRATSSLNGVDYASGDRGYTRLLPQITRAEPALEGRTFWALGVSQLRQGSYDSATVLYRRALPYIQRSREAANQASMAHLLAEGLLLAGQSHEGLEEAYRGLRMLAPHRRYVHLNNHLGLVAGYARNQGLSHAGLALSDEVVEVAGRLEPRNRALAYSSRARDRSAVGLGAGAQEDLDQALRLLPVLEPGPGGDRIRAHVRLAAGQLARARDPGAALSHLTGAIEAYTGFVNEYLLPVALYEGALAARATGDSARARKWLRQAVDFVERQQMTFFSLSNRVTFYETVENVFDEMVVMELEAGRPDSALRVLERGRVHLESARGRTNGPAAAVVEAGEVRSRLPADMLLVEYALLRDQVVIWTLSRRGGRQYTLPVSRATMTRLAQQIVGPASVNGGPDASAQLFDLLLHPLRDELRGIRQLTIVPDRELYRVPFAALRDGATGRYVAEAYSVRTVPSAGYFVAAASLSPPRARATGALVVGNPRVDSAAARVLPSLPGADREAVRVAGLYPGATLLREGGASRTKFLEHLPWHTIIHFAGHAIFNPEQPELSYLALAPDRPGGGGILRAREISGLRLSNVRVVVLSACSSLSPRASRTGAVAGLAYSFLRAGAPATVSTLWDVQDGASVELLVRFHHHLAAGTSAAEALRLAQVEALRSPRPELRDPRTWAAFVYTGP